MLDNLVTLVSKYLYYLNKNEPNITENLEPTLNDYSIFPLLAVGIFDEKWGNFQNRWCVCDWNTGKRGKYYPQVRFKITDYKLYIPKFEGSWVIL